jgi:hypothetical protein
LLLYSLTSVSMLMSVTPLSVGCAARMRALRPRAG